jgi:hypothetical protein
MLVEYTSGVLKLQEHVFPILHRLDRIRARYCLAELDRAERQFHRPFVDVRSVSNFVEVHADRFFMTLWADRLQFLWILTLSSIGECSSISGRSLNAWWRLAGEF